MFKYLILFFLFASSFTMRGQSFTMLEIKDSNFYSILDTILEAEKKCDYYAPNLMFLITVEFEDTSTSSIRLDGHEILYAEDDFWKYYGCFIYQGHLFFVFDDEIGRKYIRDFLFNKTAAKQNVELYQRPPNELIVIDGQLTEWHYWYKNKEFIFDYMGSECMYIRNKNSLK